MGKAVRAGMRDVVDRHNNEPFNAFNNAHLGITIKGLEQLMVHALVRIVNPPRSKVMIQGGSGFEGIAKIC